MGGKSYRMRPQNSEESWQNPLTKAERDNAKVLLHYIIKHYGSRQKAAKTLRLSEGQITGILYGDRCTRINARLILRHYRKLQEG